MAVVRAAPDGARRYLARPDIFHLHGVTGAMAVEILAAHIPAPDGAAALAHVHAEHAALYAATARWPNLTRPAREAASSPRRPCAAWTRTRSSWSRPVGAGMRQPVIRPSLLPRKRSPARMPDRRPAARLSGSGPARWSRTGS